MTLTNDISNLHYNTSNIDLLKSYGLNAVTIAWEDSARNKNSSWGPNISDMTLTVETQDVSGFGRDKKRMPMIRKPNFTDVSCDLEIDHFHVTVGNESKDGTLQRISLQEYIENLEKYNTESYNVESEKMFIERDQHILASAQACILPDAQDKDVEFVPELFNYQSSRDNPAVLVIVSTNQGTSSQIITQHNQPLYFNRDGEATKFVAKRLEDDRKERKVETTGEMTQDEQDQNVILIFQIPLKQRARPSFYFGSTVPSMMLGGGSILSAGGVGIGECMGGGMFDLDPIVNQSVTNVNIQGFGARSRGMDHAILKASDTSFGTFDGLKKHKLMRDERFPIRLTYQYYKITDENMLKEKDVADIAERIKKLYDAAEKKGSLVINSETNRLTEIKKKELRSLDNVTNIGVTPPLFGKRESGDDFEKL